MDNEAAERETMFDFTQEVNESDIKRGGGFTLIPNGRYTAAFQGAVLHSAETGQRIETEWVDFETPDGQTEIHRDGATINLAGRRSKRYTLWGGDREKLVKFAQAFNLAVSSENGNGKVWKLATKTPEEFVEAVNTQQGKRFLVGIRQAPRKRGGQIVTKEDGSNVVDDNIYWVDSISK